VSLFKQLYRDGFSARRKPLIEIGEINIIDHVTFTEDDSGALRRAKPLDLSKRKMTK